MPERVLRVVIIGDDASLKRTLTSSTRAVKTFDKQVEATNLRTAGLGQAARGGLAGAGLSKGALLFGSGAFVGTAALSSVLRKSITAASDLNEQISKSNAVFGKSAQTIQSWSKTTASAFGVSRVAALEAAGTFGNLFSTVGLGPAAAAKMSKSLVELAADLASFNNADISDVLLAIRSGLVGEAEPLRKFGVLLSETRVQQVALAQTGKTNVKALTDQEKALARYNIILRDTAPAQGDFQRTSGGLANQTRILQANVNDLAGTFGTTLVPSLAAGLQGMNDLLTGTNNLITGLGNLRDQIKGTDFFEGFNQGVEDASGGVSDFFLNIRDNIPLLERFKAAVTGIVPGQGAPPPPSDTGPQRRAGARAARRADAEAKLEGDLKKSSKRFDAAIKGLGLKLDKAQLTRGLADDLAVAREIERRIRRQIAIEGHTFDLEKQLTDARKTEQDILDRISSEQEQKATDAEQRRADKAQAERDKRKRIRDRETAKRRAEAADRKADQFKSLGLTAEGDRPTPSAGALLRRAQSLQDQVKGTSLDTSKTRQELQRIVGVLKKNFKTAGKDVREAILQMLNDITDALSGKSTKGVSVQTKFVKQGIGKLLDGLGLSPEQIKELEQRFAQRGPGGTVPGRGTSAFGFALNTSTATLPRSGFGDQVFHIYIDGEEVEARVTRRQQKKRGRQAPSRRGTSPGMHR